MVGRKSDWGTKTKEAAHWRERAEWKDRSLNPVVGGQGERMEIRIKEAEHTEPPGGTLASGDAAGKDKVRENWNAYLSAV